MLRNEKKELLSVEKTMECYDCCPREEQFIYHYIREFPIEKIEEFYRFLQGELPDNIHMKRSPHLSEQMAFRIIYFLQEQTGIFPDHIERCKTCGCLYDSECEGNNLHCDDCRRD